jgi:hypothetical protein
MLVSVFILMNYNSAFGRGIFYPEPGPPVLTVSPTAYQVGQTGSYSIRDGKQPVHIANMNSAVVRTSGGSNSGTVTAVAPGGGALCARDAKGRQSCVNVSVSAPPLNISIDNTNITVGQKTRLNISGGNKPYNAYNRGDQRVLSLNKISDNAYEITGLMPGKATIYVVDKEIYAYRSQWRSASVTVQPPPFTAVAYKSSIKVNESTPVTLRGGIQPYTVLYYNQNVLHVGRVDNIQFYVRGLRPGESNIEFKDAQGKQAVVRMVVTGQEIKLQASINPNKISIGGGPATLTINSGIGPYTVTEPGGLTSIRPFSVNEYKVYDNRKPGSANITARDVSGQAVQLQLTIVSQPLPMSIQLTPPKDVFSLNERFTCTISGGIPNYTVNYSAPGIVKETQTGVNTFNFQSMKKGITDIKIVDRNGTTQTKRVEVR